MGSQVEVRNGLPGGMAQAKAPVLVHRRIARDHCLMRLKSARIASCALPGQFIHLLCGEPTLLRRPFSLLDADPRAGTLDFIYKVVGSGTRALTHLSPGDRVDLLGPLGTPFKMPPDAETAYLIGGGVGIPPLYLLAKRLLDLPPAGSRRVVAFLGARTKDWVICADGFRRLGIPVHVATDDGTSGHRGSVVDLLRRFLPTTRNRGPAPVLYICGPTPMMAAAAALADRRDLPAQVSLEERMGCAMGCCMGCVVEVAAEPAGSHARFQRVCTEGPVFQADEIVWR
ncbi:MAG: dihydroorotate dehydrogenase electron transfer subunit [Candidatus Omnitrophica bacterium]|nr:dihydroorotate dehydrogenase electron transfer subunit [Candidatus Omnitrophota bacterium]